MLTPKTYSLISRLSLPLILSGFGLRSLSQKAYRERLGERLGFLGTKRFTPGGFVIHASSVGEVIALRPFIQGVIDNFYGTPITVTTFTPTGSDQVKATFGDRVQHCFLPIDSPGSVSRFLDHLKPEVLVLMETEIWPNLLQQTHQRNIRTLLINGRISERSFPKYQKIRTLVASSLKNIDNVLTQSNEDAERFIALGARRESTRVMGNLKYDIAPSQGLQEQTEFLRSKLEERPIWVIGSTHENEESLYLDAAKNLHTRCPNILIIIAPRHVERVHPLSQALEKSNLRFIKRSENKTPEPYHSVWLIDTLGELMLFYSLAHVTTVAGTFDETGGHNPLEPAALKKAIVCGPNMKNFQEIIAQLIDKKAIVQVKSREELEDKIEALLNSDKVSDIASAAHLNAVSLGDNAFEVVQTNQGATAKALEALKTLHTACG